MQQGKLINYIITCINGDETEKPTEREEIKFQTIHSYMYIYVKSKTRKTKQLIAEGQIHVWYNYKEKRITREAITAVTMQRDAIGQEHKVALEVWLMFYKAGW